MPSGLVPWLRRVISGNPHIDAEITRLRQELEWVKARADRAERVLSRDQSEQCKLYAKLNGQFKHYCPEWDFMAIDETCPEFDACLCFASGAR